MSAMSDLDVQLEDLLETRPANERLQGLTAHDRCDRCSARALTAVAHPAGLLTFCGHHHRKYEGALLEQGAVIAIDERD